MLPLDLMTKYLGGQLWPRNTSLTASVIGNCHFAGGALQQGHLGRVLARATMSRLRTIAIELGCGFGSDRRRLWVGNPRALQIARAARRDLVLRAEGRRVLAKHLRLWAHHFRYLRCADALVFENARRTRSLTDDFANGVLRSFCAWGECTAS